MEDTLVKIFEVPEWKGVAVDDDVLAEVNKFALKPLSADEIWVRRMTLAGDAYDRDHERFSPTVLRQFAETLPGKSFLIGHAHDTAPVGRFFRATVKGNESGKRRLESHIYGLRDGNGIEPYIDAGIYHSVSIGFKAEKLLCDVCGGDMKSGTCPHYPGKTYDSVTATGTWEGKAEALEGSLVFLGSQRGAQFVKAADRKTEQGLNGSEEKIWEETDEWVHHSLKSADLFVRLRSMWLSAKDQIQARVGPLKSDPDGGTKVQSLLFKKPKWTMETSKTWMREHPDVGKAFLDSLRVAMAGVLGARSGVRGPKSEYDELAAQYREFGEEPPEWRVHSQNALRKCFGDVWATVKAVYDIKDGEDVDKIEELEGKVGELEAQLKTATEEVGKFKSAAAEAEVLRGRLVAEIIGKLTVLGLESLYDVATLNGLPGERLLKISEDMSKKVDDRFPPTGIVPAADPKKEPAKDLRAYQLR